MTRAWFKHFCQCRWRPRMEETKERNSLDLKSSAAVWSSDEGNAVWMFNVIQGWPTLSIKVHAFVPAKQKRLILPSDELDQHVCYSLAGTKAYYTHASPLRLKWVVLELKPLLWLGTCSTVLTNVSTQLFLFVDTCKLKGLSVYLIILSSLFRLLSLCE